MVSVVVGVGFIEAAVVGSFRRLLGCRFLEQSTFLALGLALGMALGLALHLALGMASWLGARLGTRFGARFCTGW